MAEKNIRFYGHGDGLCKMVDLYLLGSKSFDYEDSFNYCNINVDKLLLYKKSDNEYVIRYNDVNKMNVVPLQIKSKIFLFKIYQLKNSITP